ncbi:oxygen-independent coproporphyrinogen-3 oxidase [Caloranaerobacter azorensis DSM 13643]|uniref:Heme chaperone HemW n=1 Tax=Caloranaerobacter azorensis DSM 13643 TaxID=1121264 RepID=A0A1M5S660_9FIRM|nr:radical SAM family heme chaperone HemW [Caloranaerobacter azorensis]SHH34112.1 oxygen-independent coproporphyrinogen-3 oxidase [Caloranaerobacter azorensis DSM 13643]
MNELLGIYIHIPFCVSKCFYCDFNSYTDKSYIIKDYIKYLKKEIDLYSVELKDYKVKTIFIGGGTPSSIDSKFLCDIVNHIYKKFNLSTLIEFTVEANPKTLDKYKLKDYKNLGINRMSLGLQSFNDKLLKSIGRIHTARDFLESYDLIRKFGFDNVNVDVMFNLPGQTIKDVIDTLKKVIALKPEHISFYSLKIEEGTLFYKLYNESRLDLPDEDTERDMYHKGIELLEDNNFIHYEISNFAKHGYECKHNLIYWNVKPYLGLGLSAHSNINSKRWSNFRNFKQYFKCLDNGRLPIEENEEIDVEMEMAEFMILGLRLIKGIEKLDFKKRFGLNVDDIYGMQLRSLENKGLIENKEEYIKLTKRGIDLSNLVFMELLP